MRIAIVTDAWEPQVNGVVRTLRAVLGELEKAGHEVSVIAPDQFASLPCPTYPEIRLVLAGRRRVGRAIDAIVPVAIWIASGAIASTCRAAMRRVASARRISG